jgi:hypothetical protein
MEIPTNASPGTHWLTARKHGLVSNRVPFVLDALPEAFEREPNNAAAWAQKITLPVIINGRIGQRGDWDVFEFTGRSNDTVIMEVQARRLASPLDSIIKLTDQTGQLLALNDDHPDAGAGVNTHQADSYLSVRLSVDGTYYIHIGDTAGQGGPEYAYRLRVSAPQPDFELRVVPSSVSLRSKSAAPLTVYALRKDGFDGPIQLSSKDPPSGFSVTPATIGAGQTVGRLTLKTTLAATEEPLNLTVTGTANIGDGEVTREAVPAEDRMQAFLWRSLVPAQELKVLVFDPSYQPPPKHVAPVRPRAIAGTNTPPPAAPAPAVIAATTTNLLAGTNGLAGTNAAALAAKPKFSKQLVAARLRQLKLLFEEGMLTEDFYVEKVFECEAGE